MHTTHIKSKKHQKRQRPETEDEVRKLPCISGTAGPQQRHNEHCQPVQWFDAVCVFQSDAVRV